jgi:hypothetical protein
MLATPAPTTPTYAPGTLLRVMQTVRVGAIVWQTQVTGRVETEGVRPVGGMEMGSKALYCRQSTLLLRRDDGELTSVALDENSRVEVL